MRAHPPGSARRTSRRRRRRAVAGLLAAVAMVGLAFWLWRAPAPVAGGTPRLETDRVEIDFGDVRFGTPVTATFTLRNAGDGTLAILGVPPVRATEGC